MINKITLILSMASIAVCFLGMILAHKEAISANAGGLLFVLSGLLGLAAMCCAVAVLFTTKAYPVAMIGVFGLMPFVAVLSGLVGGMQHPRINDISTDTGDPPQYVEALKIPRNAGRDMGFPAGNAPLIAAHYPAITPLALNLSPQQAYERALEVAQAHAGWEITRKDPAALSFEGVAATKLFRWKDDFVVRVRPGAGGGARLDMRSKSRDGKSDLGANARRIEQFFKDLKKLDVGEKNQAGQQ